MNSFSYGKVADSFWIRTPIHEGEAIRGYLARNRLNGGSCLFEKLRKCDTNIEPKQWEYLSGLRSLSHALHPLLPSPDILLNNHTMAPLLRPFTEEHKFNRIRVHYLDNKQVRIDAVAGFHRTGPGAAPMAILGICVQCVEEDRAKLGYSFWRTAHNIPGVTKCVFHHMPLRTFCSSCEIGSNRAKLAFLPECNCICGRPLILVRPSHRYHSSDEQISVYIRNILNSKIPPTVGYGAILDAIHKKASEIFRTDSISSVEIHSLAVQKLGLDNVKFFEVFSGGTSKLRSAVNGKQLCSNAVRNVILLVVLFDSWDEFIRCANDSINSDKYHQIEPVVPSRTGKWFHLEQRWQLADKIKIASLKERYRTQIRDALIKTPTSTKVELDTRKPTAYRFLRAHDKEWLDATIPLKKTNQLNLRAEKDALMRDQIFLRKEEHIAKSIMTRISRNMLTKKCRTQPRAAKNLTCYPLTQTALDECEESLVDFTRRRIKSIIAKHSHTSISPEIPDDFLKMNLGQLQTILKQIRK